MALLVSHPPNTDAVPPRASAHTARRPNLRDAWKERNRTAIVDAVLALVLEGNLRPSADQIAERSGVSRRTLFRYFDDMDDLARTAIARQLTRVTHLVELPELADATLSERIAQLTQQRWELFSSVAPGLRVARLRAPFAAVAAQELERSRVQLRTQVQGQFARELKALSPSRRRRTVAAIDALCSFETYDLLCTAQSVPGAEYRAVLGQSILALLGDAR